MEPNQSRHFRIADNDASDSSLEAGSVRAEAVVRSAENPNLRGNSGSAANCADAADSGRLTGTLADWDTSSG